MTTGNQALPDDDQQSNASSASITLELMVYQDCWTAIAVYFFLKHSTSICLTMRTIWKEYACDELSLHTASRVNNAAIEHLKVLNDDLEALCSDSKIVKTNGCIPNSLSLSTTSSAASSQPPCTFEYMRPGI